MVLIIAFGSVVLLATMVVFSALTVASRFDSADYPFEANPVREQQLKRAPTRARRFYGSQLTTMNDLPTERAMKLHSK